VFEEEAGRTRDYVGCLAALLGRGADASSIYHPAGGAVKPAARRALTSKGTKPNAAIPLDDGEFKDF